MLKGNDVKIVLNEQCYINNAGEVVEVKNGNKFTYESGIKYHFAEVGAENIVIKADDRAFWFATDREYVFEKKHKSPVYAAGDSVYFISPANTLTSIQITKSGNGIRTITKCGYESYFAVSEGHSCVVSRFAENLIVNLDGKNIEIPYTDTVNNYGIHRDKITGGWLIVLENGAGQFFTFVCNEHGVAYSEDALLAYRKARRCKRYRPEVLEFEANREEYLSKARRELKSLTYTPGKYKVFKVWEPKERIIMALPFYDRVIQHMIVNYIEPIFEHQFIYHSYACRKGKGAHRASKQLTRWLYNLEVVQGKSVYVLKADIHHYFQSIDHKVLKKELRTYIKDKDLLVILDRIIDHNGIFPDGVGIPVGNLTSQLFANVYLHRLDMFVKHTLHVKYYMRYMDDFLIISDDLEQLKRWEKQIETFLAEVLKLQLNPKTTIVYAKNGVDFVGYRHWNSTKKIRKDAMRRLKRLMKNFKDGTITEEFFDKSLTSRIGSIKHADTYNLVEKITCEAKELKESHA